MSSPVLFHNKTHIASLLLLLLLLRDETRKEPASDLASMRKECRCLWGERQKTSERVSERGEGGRESSSFSHFYFFRKRTERDRFSVSATHRKTRKEKGQKQRRKTAGEQNVERQRSFFLFVSASSSLLVTPNSSPLPSLTLLFFLSSCLEASHHRAARSLACEATTKPKPKTQNINGKLPPFPLIPALSVQHPHFKRRPAGRPDPAPELC